MAEYFSSLETTQPKLQTPLGFAGFLSQSLPETHDSIYGTLPNGLLKAVDQSAELTAGEHLAAFEDFLSHSNRGMQEELYWLTLNRPFFKDYEAREKAQIDERDSNLKAVSGYIAWLGSHGLQLMFEAPDVPPFRVYYLQYDEATLCYAVPVFTPQGQKLLPLDGTHKLNILEAPPAIGVAIKKS